MEFTSKLKGKVAVVAGATRGAGRGIAVMLGEAGATVYCTGRSIRGQPSDKHRPETIEETAGLVTDHGGTGLYAQVDHTDPHQVQALFERVKSEAGRLDILVNDLTGDSNMERKPFLQHSLEKGLRLLENGSLSHIITSYYGVPLMVASGGGLLIELTDGTRPDIREFNFYYDLEKATNIRLAQSLALQLKQHKVTVVALTPGFLRSEEMLDHFGVTEPTWRDAIQQDHYFAYSETPYYVGMAVVALASDRRVMRFTGQALMSGVLARQYGFTDLDGTQPLWCY
jgi:NAD(P)-dependent dehydrogenase (short-subunit alcohol dehydrogenase family)